MSQRPRRVGEVNERHGTHPLDDVFERSVEALHLASGEGVRWIVGNSKMAEHTGKPNRWRTFGNRLRHGRGSMRVRADTLHAGINLQMHGQAGGAGCDECVEELPGVHRRRQAVLDDVPGSRGRLLAQQQDRCVDPGPAQFEPFGDQGNAKPFGTRVHRGPGHIDGTVAIAIRLHNCPDCGRTSDRAKGRDVVTNRIEIDLNPGPTGVAHCAITSIGTRVRQRAPSAGCLRDHRRALPAEAAALPPRRAARQQLLPIATDPARAPILRQ